MLGKGYVIERGEDGQVYGVIRTVAEDAWPREGTLIRVAYSSLNYKDALIATGHPALAPAFPHVPGIDAAGVVVSCPDGRFREGDRVLVTGYGLGVSQWGGYAEYIRVPPDWIVPLPSGLSLKQSMILGTAGLTAALCVHALSAAGLSPADGALLVTGASGGVGSLAIALLAHSGYRVTAVTGKKEAMDYLYRLGATDIIHRGDLPSSDRALLKERWSGAVDTVGGPILASVLKAISYGGAVAACGLVAGEAVHTTVYPFILRGITLAGIDSVRCPMTRRLPLWQGLADQSATLPWDTFATSVDLEDLEPYIQMILQGDLRGRVVVKIAPQENGGD